jgi:hypothetical protein
MGLSARQCRRRRCCDASTRPAGRGRPASAGRAVEGGRRQWAARAGFGCRGHSCTVAGLHRRPPASPAAARPRRAQSARLCTRLCARSTAPRLHAGGAVAGAAASQRMGYRQVLVGQRGCGFVPAGRWGQGQTAAVALPRWHWLVAWLGWPGLGGALTAGAAAAGLQASSLGWRRVLSRAMIASAMDGPACPAVLGLK